MEQVTDRAGSQITVLVDKFILFRSKMFCFYPANCLDRTSQSITATGATFHTFDAEFRAQLWQEAEHCSVHRNDPPLEGGSKITK